MKSNVRINYIRLIMAWEILPMVYLAWCFSTLIYANSICAVIMMLLGIIAELFYAYTNCWMSATSEKSAHQLYVLNWIIASVGILLDIVLYKEYIGLAKICAYITVSGWVILAIILLLGHQKRLSKLADRALKKTNSRLSMRLLPQAILCILVVLLAIDDNMYQFKWDGLLYYWAVSQANISSISSVALYGHVAQTSGTIYTLFSLLVGDVGYGMIIANIIVLLIGVTGFYACMTVIAPGKRSWDYSLASAVFAFSPYLLGMVNYFSLDWFAVCMCTWMIYWGLKKEWILTVLAAAIFVMTKEPSLIAYGGFCMGLVVTDILETNKPGVERIKHILSGVHYYFLLIPIIIWLVTYKMLGAWSAGDGGFGIDVPYIVDKLKLFLMFNFNWLVSLIIIVSLVYIGIKRKLLRIIHWVLPLLISNVCLLVFNCLFSTINHARYIDSFISINLILMVGLLMHVLQDEKKLIRNILLLAIASVSLMACYITFDPISGMLFDKYTEGNSYIYATSDVPYGDMSIYNKQMLWMEKPLNDAISDAIGDGSMVVLSANNNSVYSFDGMSELINLDEQIVLDKMYLKDGRRISYADINRPIDSEKYYHISTDVSIDRLPEEVKDATIIYIDGVNDYKSPDTYTLKDSKEYCYRGWKICADRFIR